MTFRIMPTTAPAQSVLFQTHVPRTFPFPKLDEIKAESFVDVFINTELALCRTVANFISGLTSGNDTFDGYVPHANLAVWKWALVTIQKQLPLGSEEWLRVDNLLRGIQMQEEYLSDIDAILQRPFDYDFLREKATKWSQKIADLPCGATIVIYSGYRNQGGTIGGHANLLEFTRQEEGHYQIDFFCRHS